jgi:K+-transporting ATPase KdpF subunit
MLSGAGMSFEYALGLVAAVALTGYLAVALVWPERF